MPVHIFVNAAKVLARCSFAQKESSARLLGDC